MAYTKKPSGPPTFDAASFTKALKANAPITDKLAAQYITWKQWVESTNAYDGADKGGIRDVLNADALAVDALKGNVDIHADRLDRHAAEIDQLKAWVAAQPRPFP